MSHSSQSDSSGKASPPKPSLAPVGDSSPVPRSPGRYIGGIYGAFQPFATARLRLESQGLLARELLLAARRNVPLPEALEAFTRSDARVPRWVWNWVIFGILAICLLAFAGAGWWGVTFSGLFFLGLLIMVGTATQSDDYRRYIGLVLCRELRRGRTLGEAFRHHPELFQPFEVTLFEAADRSGRLEQSLEAWSRHAAASERLGHTGDMALYPITVVLVILAVLSFFGAFVAAKIQDVWSQLGTSPPVPEVVPVALQFLSHTIGTRGFVLSIFLAVFLFLMVVPRRFFNGSVIGSMVFMGVSMAGNLALFWLFVAILANSRAIPEPSSGGQYISSLIGFSLLVSFGMGYLAFRWGRWLAGRGSERLVGLLSFLPGLWQAERRLSESRFLFGLEALLQAGREWPEALEDAGRGVGRIRWARAARRAAAAARQGRSPAQVLATISPLLASTRSTLSIAEFGNRLPETLRDCAEEDHCLGQRYVTRFNAIFFPLTHIIAGATTGLFVVMIYIPLFMISQSVLGPG